MMRPALLFLSSAFLLLFIVLAYVTSQPKFNNDAKDFAQQQQEVQQQRRLGSFSFSDGIENVNKNTQKNKSELMKLLNKKLEKHQDQEGLPEQRHFGKYDGTGGGRRRRIEEKTLYTANYIGRFRLLLDVTCSASKPTLEISCLNGGTLEILRMGHSSLVTLEESTSQVLVGSDCTDRADCENVFVSDLVDDDKYADVYFSCSGDRPEAAQAEIGIPRSDGGVECSGISIWTGTRAFYMLQLGVFCTPPDESAVSDGTYYYNSQYFECTDGNTLDEEFTGGKYGCMNGHNCEGLSCTKDFIEPVRIQAELSKFQDQCLSESKVAGNATSFSPEPLPFKAPAGEYTMRYQALWSFQLDTFWCGGNTPEVKVECLNGGTISLLDTFYDETLCEVLDDSTVQCEETCSSCSYYINPEYSGVSYECSGPNMEAATSRATYLSSDAYCSSSFSTSTTPGIAHRVKLGLYCGSAVLGGDFEFNDKFTECGTGNWFDQENGDGSYFACLSYDEVALPGGRVNLTLPDAVIYTTKPISEDVYELMRSNDCFKANFAPTVPTPIPTATTTSTSPAQLDPPSPVPAASPPSGIGVGNGSSALNAATPIEAGTSSSTLEPESSSAVPAPTPLSGIGIGNGGSSIGEGPTEPTFAPESFCLATCNCSGIMYELGN